MFNVYCTLHVLFSIIDSNLQVNVMTWPRIRRKKLFIYLFMRMQKMEDGLPRTFIDQTKVGYDMYHCTVYISVQCDTYKYNRLPRHQLLVQIWRESRNWVVRTPFSSYYTLMVSRTSLQLSLFFINCRNTV